MADSITKKEVFLYLANQIGRERRIEIERAYESDQQVREWFEQLDPVEQNAQAGGHVNELFRFPDVSLHERMILTNQALPERDIAPIEDCERDAQDTLFAKLVDVVRQSPDQRTNVSLRELHALDVERFGGWKSKDSYVPTSKAATSDTSHAPAPKDRFGIDGDHVYFQCPQAALPSGLCYIALVQPATGAVTLLLARLKLIGGAWRDRIPLLAALKDKPTTKVEAYVIPAEEETRAMFESLEVADFVRRLPDDDPQRLAAVAYLAAKEADDAQ